MYVNKLRNFWLNQNQFVSQFLNNLMICIWFLKDTGIQDNLTLMTVIFLFLYSLTSFNTLTKAQVHSKFTLSYPINVQYQISIQGHIFCHPVRNFTNKNLKNWPKTYLISLYRVNFCPKINSCTCTFIR